MLIKAVLLMGMFLLDRFVIGNKDLLQIHLPPSATGNSTVTSVPLLVLSNFIVPFN